MHEGGAYLWDTMVLDFDLEKCSGTCAVLIFVFRKYLASNALHNPKV